MQSPVVPDNEPLRLDALRRLAILDSPAEERFDRITRMARNMFDVPIALVSLVDETDSGSSHVVGCRYWRHRETFLFVVMQFSVKNCL